MAQSMIMELVVTIAVRLLASISIFIYNIHVM